MQKIVALVFATALLPSAAYSQNFNLPEDEPLASVIVPDSWNPNLYDGGIEATSVDGTTYLSIDVTNADKVEGATSEALKSIMESGVEIDPKSAKERQFKLNGIDAFETVYAGTKRGKAAIVSVAVAPLSARKFLFLSYASSPEGEKTNHDDLARIAGSVRKLDD